MNKHFKSEVKCKYCGGDRNPNHAFFNSHECCINCWKKKRYANDPKYKGTSFAAEKNESYCKSAADR